jgi:arsenate reductase-like glutaredoxin family protein
LAANKIDIKEEVRASQKLNEADAKKILKAANKLIVAKGKKVSEFSVAVNIKTDAIEAMLGPTGNLRAPTLVIGKTVVVGFNEEAYKKLFK